MGKKIVIGEREALNIRRQWEREVLPRVETDQESYAFVRSVFQQVSEKQESGKVGQKKHNKAEERRAWFETWYRELGFNIMIPKPAVSNREFDRRKKAGQALFYRPATKDVSYEAFMEAVGQANHWTVKGVGRAEIGWEFAATGYWFWAEVQDNCPRLKKTCWNDLSVHINLFSLEEDVVVWHAHKAETGQMLDRSTWTWLRTRFKLSDGRLGALDASECRGEVDVRGNGPGYLAIPSDNEGGRAAEVVKNVT